MVQEVSITWWAVGVATLIPMVLGALWYSPPVFGRLWLRRIGKDASDFGGVGANIAAYGTALMGSFLLAWVLATILAFAETDGAGDGLAGGFFSWLGLVAATFATNDAMERRPLGLTAINVAYWLVTLLAMGALLGAIG